uniref:Uncharacterized protein n=1 Tax=Aegilops tauschii subsp. strangulata TaxID=200361 RepID=A0A453SQU4_AEGTS
YITQKMLHCSHVQSFVYLVNAFSNFHSLNWPFTHRCIQTKLVVTIYRFKCPKNHLARSVQCSLLPTAGSLHLRLTCSAGHCPAAAPMALMSLWLLRETVSVPAATRPYVRSPGRPGAPVPPRAGATAADGRGECSSCAAPHGDRTSEGTAVAIGGIRSAVAVAW